MDSGRRQGAAFDIGSGALKPDAEIMTTGKVPLDSYFGQQRFEREREVFGHVWLNIAETAEIPDPGDWIVREVSIRSASIIIVRGKDDVIRAFHNICSHRGMKLVWEDKGKGGKFACPYHAWMYDSAGALTHIPDAACFPHVDKAQSSLSPVHCEVWEGFVFINFDEAPSVSLTEFLGPLAERLEGLPLATYACSARIGGRLHTNWKLAIEAQSEAYHVRALHARTVSKMLSSKDNPHIHPLHWEQLGAHGFKSEPRNTEYEMDPAALVQAFAYSSVGHMTDAKRIAGASTITSHPAVNPKRSNEWGNDQFVVYPHFVLHVSHGGWWMHRFWPVAPDKTDWESVYHFAEPQGLREQFALQYSLAFNRDTLLEDNFALVQQQQVMGSGAKAVAQFGEQEIQCRHIAAVHSAIAESAGACMDYRVAAE